MVYIDDLLIFNKNFDQHLEHLGQIFQNLKAANLKIHPGKCKFAAKEVKYLGHIVNKEGIKVDPSKFSAIETYPVPKNVKKCEGVSWLSPTLQALHQVICPDNFATE